MKERRSQARGAGWRSGGIAADKFIRMNYEATADEAKAAGIRLVTEREPALLAAGATEEDLAIWRANFVEAFAGKIERHLIRRAERDRKRVIWQAMKRRV